MITRSNLALAAVHLYILSFLIIVYLNQWQHLQKVMYLALPMGILLIMIAALSGGKSKNRLKVAGKK
jgi:hypothetical protein